MKELKIGEIIQQHYPLPQQRVVKRWSKAYSRRNFDGLTVDNEPTEAAYHRVITQIKTLHLQPNEIYFERDYKQDRTEGLYGMHAFLTAGFYWRLDCLFTNNYQISFAFNHCGYESKIRKLMQAYPLDRVAIEKQLQPDFNTFFTNVLSIQEDKYIHSLTR